jgi:hypothetical protein
MRNDEIILEHEIDDGKQHHVIALLGLVGILLGELFL